MSAFPTTFTQEELKSLLDNLHTFAPAEQAQLLEIIDELEARQHAEKCRTDLIEFAKHMMPDYKVGTHHKQLAEYLEDLAHGRKDRITVSIAPRFGKSQLTSIFFPAWFIGNWPDKKIMIVSHTADLAVDFGRKVRNLINSDEYKAIFQDVALAADSKSAGRWNTNKGGEFFAVGVGGALAGRGAHLLVVDDPHNEQEILNGNFDIFEKAHEWYAYGARTRLMPGGSVAIVATRWAEQDLIGQVQKDMIRNPDADQWDVVEFPALLERRDSSPEEDDTERYISLWPEQWSLESLLRTKASMPPFQWSAQYMQQPTSRDAAIIKREWWNAWTKDDPPACEYVIMSLDAAAEKTNRSDFTALTTWGVFYEDDEHGQPQANIILLNSIKERLEFPELKRLAYAQYKHWSPDWFIIERKSSGSPLYQEMRRGGIPVQDYTPHRGTGDKVMRLNSVSDIFATGLVWYPAGRRWAEEVVDEVCGFPAMPHDDLVDSTVMALMRFRDGGFIRLPSDIWEDDYDFKPVRASYY